MKTSSLHTDHLTAKKPAVLNPDLKDSIPTAEDYPETFALFAGIYKSDKFTVDNLHRAFSEALRKKQSD